MLRCYKEFIHTHTQLKLKIIATITFSSHCHSAPRNICERDRHVSKVAILDIFLVFTLCERTCDQEEKEEEDTFKMPNLINCNDIPISISQRKHINHQNLVKCLIRFMFAGRISQRCDLIWILDGMFSELRSTVTVLIE